MSQKKENYRLNLRTVTIQTGLYLTLICSPSLLWALDPSLPQNTKLSVPKSSRENPLAPFNSSEKALRIGVLKYNSGDKVGAVRALEYAAADGRALALWRLGRMYCDGDGVERNDLKAFENFSILADRYADVPPNSPLAPIAANAFVTLGSYYLKGIEGTYIKKDPARSREMFHYAATYFSNPEAQYNLARIHIDGIGIEKNTKIAARWLKLAAEKNHYPSQALLGYLLMNGNGIPRQRARGFMWLIRARDSALNTISDKDQWIFTLYQEADKVISEKDRTQALSLLRVKHR